MYARRILLIAAAAATVLSARAGAETLDQGTFRIYRHDQPLGAETFLITQGHDSLAVQARQYLTLQGEGGAQPLERAADVLVSRTDFSLQSYVSTRTFMGKTIKRGIVLSDTHYVAYREDDRGGVGESNTLPPGHVYVMDSQLVTLFDLICRSFQDRKFRSRDINLLALGPHDTMLVAHAEVIGTETIRWGQKSVVAHKLKLTVDTRTTFTFWIGPRGSLLRLVEPTGGLRAERDALDTKRQGAASPPPRPGG